MDTVQHAYMPALVTYSNGGSALEVIASGVIGASPDIIGAYGNFVKKDNWALYNKAHSDKVSIESLFFGTILVMLSMLVGFGFFFGVGIGFVGIHLGLDRLVHGEGMRWWVKGERLWLNTLLWIVCGIAALFANPTHPWFSLIGFSWAIGLTSYLLSRD